MEFKLKGGSAILVAVVLFAGNIGYRMFLHNDLVTDPKIRQELEQSLIAEISTGIRADTDAIDEALENGDTETAEALALESLQWRVEIGDLAMRGRGKNIIIKTDYVLTGPNGSEKKIRYFKFSHSPVSGWRYRWETSAFSWNLKIF